MKKFDEIAEKGLTLNVKNLHIHLDEHTEIKNEYPHPDCDRPACHCEDDGCVFDDGDCGEDDFPDEDEDDEDSLTEADVVKAVSGATGIGGETVRKILDTQAELLLKHLMADIGAAEHPSRKRAGAQ